MTASQQVEPTLVSSTIEMHKTLPGEKPDSGAGHRNPNSYNATERGSTGPGNQYQALFHGKRREQMTGCNSMISTKKPLTNPETILR